MEMLFGNKGTQHYIDVKVNTIHNLKNNSEMYHIHMLENNEIPHLWIPTVMYVDGVIWLRHNTEHYYVFERLLSQTELNKEMFRQIMEQIFCCILELEEYLLNPDNLVLHTDYMFWNASKQELKIIYLPGRNKDIRLQLKDFFERIMKQFDHKDGQGLELLYGSYGMVVDENMDIKQLEKMICGQGLLTSVSAKQERTLESSVDASLDAFAKNDTKPSRGVTCDEKTETENNRLFAGKLLITISLACASAWFFFEYLLFHGNKKNIFVAGVLLVAVVFISLIKSEEEDEEDMAMREYQQVNNYHANDYQGNNSPENNLPEYVGTNELEKVEKSLSLIPLTNGALEPLTLSVGETSANIGRGKQENTYRLAASQISRLHASVYIKDDGLYVKDCNSTNGTFVNANRLVSGVEYRVKKGDIVAFANEEFYVS